MKKRSSLLRALALILVAIMLMGLVACSSNEAAPSNGGEIGDDEVVNIDTKGSNDTAGGTEDRPRGGTVTYASTSNPAAFFTPYNQGTVNSYAWVCYEPLAWDKADGNFYACLAESWDVDKENNTMTIKIREGITFHNGDTLDADDVVFTLSCREEYGTDGLIGSPKVEAVDPYTVKVSWEKFSLNFETWILPQYIYSKETFEEKGLDWMLNNMVGTGPYVMEEYIPDVSLRFGRNENYWREETPAPDNFEWIVIPDKTALMAAYMNGEFDVFRNVSDRVTLEQLNAAGFVATDPIVADGNNNLALPISIDPNDPFANVDVRKAVYMGVDWDSMGKSIAGPSAYHTDVLGFPLMPYYKESLEKVEYDVDKALQMLADAGYPEGFDTTIYATSFTAADSTYLQAELKKLNINAEIVTIDHTQLGGEYLGGEATQNGILLSGYRFYMTNQTDRFNKFLSPDGTWAGTTAYPQEIVDLWEKVSTAKTQEEQNQYLYDYVDAYMNEYCLAWSTYNTEGVHYYQDWIHVTDMFDTCSAGCDPFEIWIEEP